MFQNKMSLRLRIFISMILLVFTATLLVLGSTYYQYRTESDQYNSYRQERKESQLKRQINYIVNKYNLSENYDIWEDYQSDFEEIMKTYLHITLFKKVFTESSKKAYVINSTDLIEIENNIITFKGRVFELDAKNRL